MMRFTKIFFTVVIALAATVLGYAQPPQGVPAPQKPITVIENDEEAVDFPTDAPVIGDANRL